MITRTGPVTRGEETMTPVQAMGTQGYCGGGHGWLVWRANLPSTCGPLRQWGGLPDQCDVHVPTRDAWDTVHKGVLFFAL